MAKQKTGPAALNLKPGSAAFADLTKPIPFLQKLPKLTKPFLNLSICDRAYITAGNQAMICGTYNQVRLVITSEATSGLPIPPLHIYFKIQVFEPGVYSVILAYRVIELNGINEQSIFPVISMKIGVTEGAELSGDGVHQIMPQVIPRKEGRIFHVGGENRATLQLEGWVDGVLANAQRLSIFWAPPPSQAALPAEERNHDRPARLPHAPRKR